jgi:penicillin-binding protein 1A
MMADRDPQPNPFAPREPWDPRHAQAADAFPATDEWVWSDEEPSAEPPRRRIRWLRWAVRVAAVGIVLFVAAVAWLAVTAPLSKSLEPPTPPSITITASDGTPIARRGAILGAPVDAATLPDHVTEAFLAIEDRRFYSHWGIDPRGIARAAWSNVGSGGVRQGGSTITQQLAKNAFLDSDRTAARKLREALIAFWLEAWLTKNDILSRYLSNVYFGDNVYGLTAASKHYFGRTPQRLNIGQAAMLAGLVKAPSRLAPTGNLKGARARQAVVVAAMVDAGFLTEREADRVQPQRVLPRRPDALPTGTYFADWVLPEAREAAGEVKSEATVETTLDRRLQRLAERVVKGAGLRGSQAALVAMRPDGRVVAMVGGKDYKASTFNRATQAKRQPGSTFKLFVYLTALRSGLTPESTVLDEQIDIAGWKPRNYDNRYLGEIPLRRAFARSSNVAAARLTQQVGVRNVIKTARDLGLSTPIANEATIGLGTAQVSLLELTAAYASIAHGEYPVRPHGVEDRAEKGWLQSITDRPTRFDDDQLEQMRELLSASIGATPNAQLSIDAHGKTGTTQDGRDALFIGYARDLVVGVWVGNDDNTPIPGLMGGGMPALIWRDFMQAALDIPPIVREPEEDEEDLTNAIDAAVEGNGAFPFQGELEGLGINLKMTPEGGIQIGPSREREREPGREPLPDGFDGRGPPPRDEEEE